MKPNPQIPADFVTFTEEIFNGKFHFLCSGRMECSIKMMISFSLATNQSEDKRWNLIGYFVKVI